MLFEHKVFNGHEAQLADIRVVRPLHELDLMKHSLLPV